MTSTSTSSVVHHPFGVDPCDQQNHPIFNATTQKRNAVDPRTGLFEAYVPLPSIVGNNGEGPVVDMSLFYSPLVNNHAGLGDGWSFAFTCYREEQGQLTLHSGEVLSVTKDTNTEAHGVVVNWHSGRLSVKRPDGRKDILKEVGNSKVWLPVSIAVADRSSVMLAWEQEILAPEVKAQFAGLLSSAAEKSSLDDGYIRLRQVADENRVLVRLEYTSSQVVLVFWPEDESERLSYTLTLSDYALTRIEAPAGHACLINYQDHAQCGRLLRELTTFEGVKEVVAYHDNGLTFKDNAKLSALPCVSQHTLTPRGGSSQPIVTTYTYQREVSTNGQYSTTATQGGNVYRIVYLYGEDHELKKETISEGTFQVERECSFENEIKCTDISYVSAGRIRKLTESVRFDRGQLVAKHLPTGSCAYAAAKFPREANRLMMQGSKGDLFGVSPSERAVTFGVGEPVGTAGYSRSLVREEMKSSPDLNGEAAWLRFSIKEGNESLAERMVVMNFSGGMSARIMECRGSLDRGRGSKFVSYFYQDDMKNWIHINTDNFLVSVTGVERLLTTRRSYSPGRNSGMGTLRGDETTSILSGRLVRQTDADGNRTTYAYDAHGRLTTLTTCAQNETFEQVTTYSYPSVGRLEITEPDGRQRASEDDGLGNLIAEYAREDAQKPWRQTLKVEYDNRGRKHKTTRYDLRADGTQASEWCELEYDAWNQQCKQTYSTGQEVFNQYDPIAHTRTQWIGKATDKQRKITTYNSDNTVASIEWLDVDGKQSQKETLTYTHAAQVHTRTTEGIGSWRRVTYTYDDAGRMLAQAHDERTAADADENTTYTYRYEYPENWLMTEPSKVSLDGDVLGEREYDRLGRVTKLTRGDVSETYVYQGMHGVPKSRTSADGVTLEYEYFPELGNQIKTVTGKSGEKVLGTQSFTYAHGRTRQSSASEGGQTLIFEHDLNERVKQQHASLHAKAETTVSREFSELGRLLSETDAVGCKSTFSYNDKGQRSQVVSGSTTTQHEYDDRGRLGKDTVKFGNDEVTVRYRYDTGGQELSRQFTLADAFDLSIKREYSAEGRLQHITLYDVQAKSTLGSHTYTYTAGGAVASCSSTGVWQPKNPKGKPISNQAFTYDSLGNVTVCVSTFGTQSCTSSYTYDSTMGFRLQKLEHSHADYKRAVTIDYDAAGRVTKDATGKTYAYDWLGRLVQAGSRHYSYDPLNRLASSADRAGSTPHQLIYDGFRVRGEYPVSEHQDQRIVLPGSSACQVQKNKAGSSERTLFNLCDDDGSVLVSFDVVSRRPVHHAYSAYGEHSSNEQGALHGYNGEYREAEGDQYPLGHGYRWYVPQIMQFQAQDGASPFDQGGPNAYGYCDGDPVNHTDRNGQWKLRREHWDIAACDPPPLGFGKDGALISAIIFGGITVITAVMTGGTSLLITAALVGLAVVSAATAVAGALVAEKDPETARVLGWVSLAAGMAGGVAQLGKKLVRLTVQLARSGKQVARQLLQKGANALRSLRRGPAASPRSVAKPAPGALRSIAKESLGELHIGELHGFQPNLRADPGAAFKSIANADSPWAMIHQDLADGTLSQAFKVLGVGDLNTVTYVVSGALGNSGSDGEDVIHRTDSWVNNFTTLPWGDWKALAKIR